MKRIVFISLIIIICLSSRAELQKKFLPALMSLPAIGFGIDTSNFFSSQISLSYLRNNFYFGARYYKYKEIHMIYSVGGPAEKLQETSLLIGKAFSSNTKKILYIAFSTGLSYNITELEKGEYNEYGYRDLEHKETFGLPLDIFVSYPLTKHIALAANCSYNFNSVKDNYKGMIMIQLGDFTNYNYQP